MTLRIDLTFFKKLSADLTMAVVSAVPLMATLYLKKQEAILFTPYLLFATAALFIFAVIWILLRHDEKPGGFSIPTISEYPTVQEALPLPEVPRVWSIRLLQEMEWKRFERLCLWYFLVKGVKATLTEKGTNGYIELKLDGAAGVNAVVRHKTSIKHIGVKDIKSLLTQMAQMGISKGFYMASGSFSEDAKTYAKEHNVTLISGGMLLTMLKRLKPASQVKLLKMATEGDYKTPTCPACNVKMVSLHGPHQNKYYWGCVNKPKCKHIRPRREQRMLPREKPRNKKGLLQSIFGHRQANGMHDLQRARSSSFSTTTQMTI